LGEISKLKLPVIDQKNVLAAVSDRVRCFWSTNPVAVSVSLSGVVNVSLAGSTRDPLLLAKSTVPAIQ
jgi:hypothetical protein